LPTIKSMMFMEAVPQDLRRYICNDLRAKVNHDTQARRILQTGPRIRAGLDESVRIHIQVALEDELVRSSRFSFLCSATFPGFSSSHILVQDVTSKSRDGLHFKSQR
jgi:hypothetical protein